ncbi:MAG: prepilin-type N-terminal cleavage/methylation domain-containing protein [Patescibacteria group bacterium]
MKKLFHTRRKGFTLVELMISVGIFALMTSFLLAKYGTFNQSVLLTNLAYDIALSIRNAQSFGLNVRSVPGSTENFDAAYGVHFDTTIPGAYVFFSDPEKDGVYDDINEITTYTIKRGSVISGLCVGSSADDCSGSGGTQPETLDITFKRPNPNAIIKMNEDDEEVFQYAEINLRATDGSMKKIVVRSTGQIAIQN